MKVRVDGLAWLPKGELSDSQLRNLRESLTCTPQKVGDYGDGEIKPIYLYEETVTHFGMARGFFERHRREHHDVDLQVSEGLKHLYHGGVRFNGTPRAEQAQALDVVTAKLRAGSFGGIIRATPAWVS